MGAFHGLRGYRFNLQISNSSIKTFPHQIFNTLTSVSFLSLSLARNKLNSFEPFKNSTKIPVINQHGTILHSLDLVVSSAMRSTVSIKGNNLKCNCNFWWLLPWLSIWPDQRNKWSTLYCENKMPILEVYDLKEHSCNLSYNPTGNVILILVIFAYYCKF